MIGLLRCALALVLLFGVTARVMAEERIALIVGNSGYGSVEALDNPANDARLMAEALEMRGFQVTILLDATQIDLKRGIAQFGRDLRAAGREATGLFYYAGHGVQSFGRNYLLPVDVSLTDAADLDLVSVAADSVLRQMASARNRTNIVILDACRNNPFETIADMNDNGLAEMKAPAGTLLAYSTAPGAVAMDGAGDNSPYTRALVDTLATPGLPIEQLFKKVRISVMDQTNGFQTPWETSSLIGDFMFEPAAAPNPIQVATVQLWEQVKATNDPLQVMLYLRAYPNSPFADEAQAMLEARLTERGETFKRRDLADFKLAQVNVWDPDGNHIHIDFPLDEETG